MYEYNNNGRREEENKDKKNKRNLISRYGQIRNTDT